MFKYGMEKEISPWRRTNKQTSEDRATQSVDTVRLAFPINQLLARRQSDAKQLSILQYQYCKTIINIAISILQSNAKQLSQFLGGSLLEWSELRDWVAPGKSRISQPRQNTQISLILHFSLSVDAKYLFACRDCPNFTMYLFDTFLHHSFKFC